MENSYKLNVTFMETFFIKSRRGARGEHAVKQTRRNNRLKWTEFEVIKIKNFMNAQHCIIYIYIYIYIYIIIAVVSTISVPYHCCLGHVSVLMTISLLGCNDHSAVISTISLLSRPYRYCLDHIAVVWSDHIAIVPLLPDLFDKNITVF